MVFLVFEEFKYYWQCDKSLVNFIKMLISDIKFAYQPPHSYLISSIVLDNLNIENTFFQLTSRVIKCEKFKAICAGSKTQRVVF